MALEPQIKTLQRDSDPSPTRKHSHWRFGDLPVAQWLPLLQRRLLTCEPTAHWQLVWLNNAGQPLVGLLPKVSWSLYADTSFATEAIDQESIHADSQSPLYNVIKTQRKYPVSNNEETTARMSYSDWQAELIAYSNSKADAPLHAQTNGSCAAGNSKNDNRYTNGLIGFIGYDIAARDLSSSVQREKQSQPCAVLGHYDIYLAPLADGKSWTLHINSGIDVKANANQSEIADKPCIDKLIGYLDDLDIQLSAANKDFPKAPALKLHAQWQKRTYEYAFGQTQRYLEQGDCYQINLTQAWQGMIKPFTHVSNVDAPSARLIDYLAALHQNTRAPFAGYLHTHHKSADLELLSCSPELFFTFHKDKKSNTHHIRTKPIKGTVPRGLTRAEDEILKQQLIDSEKDRSENVMIVDLLRNDLGKYAKTGTVKVPQLFDIESFSNVHHMVSTITAELKDNVHPLAVLFGSLPAGSITGTPKIRAVEIISELEQTPRGAYCGTMGYMNFDGSGQWNVLIRTLQANRQPNGNNQVSLWAGGGITVASDCAAEYQECLDKVGNLLAVLSKK